MHDNYVTEASFKTYVDYLALKRHFTNESYDYHKYNGKIRASFESFQTRNDAFYFAKLSQKQDTHNLLLSNIVKNPKIWVRELCEEQAEQIYLDWKKRIDGLTYHFTNDLSKLNEDYKTNFSVSANGQTPKLISLYLQKQISLETFSILAHLSNVFPYWSAEVKDKIVAGDIIKLSQKYYPFLNIDKKKFQAIVKERFF
jgi:hypothetical protein